MKKILLVSSVALLSACAETTSGKLNQTVYDLDSAYHTLAVTMPDVMEGKVPGITLTEDQKTLIKKSSQSVFNEIQSLEDSIQAGNTLTETSVSALQTDFATLQECWIGLKTGTTSTSCNSLAVK